MKIFTRIKPKPRPKPVIPVVGTVRGWSSHNISDVPQYPTAIPFRHQPAREFVPPSPRRPPVFSSRNEEPETREREQDGGFWNWTNPSDHHNHSRSISHWQREDGQRDIGGMIGYLTVTFVEDSLDSALVRDVCERASATEANAKEATKALRREFKYGDAPRQISAAKLLAIMLGNSSELFIHQCAEHKFMDTLEYVLYSRRTSPIVRERLLEVIAAAAYASSEVWHENESTFRALWKKAKPVGMPDVGVPFGPGNAIFKQSSSERDMTISHTPRDLPAHPQSLQVAAPKRVERTITSHAMQPRRELDPPAQGNGFSNSSQGSFECAICMDQMPANTIARIDSCGHAFCRECLRGHVTARLDERRYPIFCPTCTATTTKGKGKGKVGEVSLSLAQNLGLTDKQYNIWIEMELAPFSVLLHCRRCKRSMFVARDEHEEANVIVCPLPDCNHAWCKQCQRSIKSGGRKHSCDGTAELDNLMKQNGWKYCPTCKTPIQKVGGCNHMKCEVPACNTHFCYLCGDLIVKSAKIQEISPAIARHFGKNCRPLVATR